MKSDNDIRMRHPRLFAKCRELVSTAGATNADATARVLASLIVLTAMSEGRSEVEMTDTGDVYRLPRRIRRMRLHRLMEARQ